MMAPNVSSMLHVADEGFAALVWSCFEPELAATSDVVAAETVKHAAAAALSWATWDYLRTAAKLTSSGAADVFSLSCHRLLGSD